MWQEVYTGLVSVGMLSFTIVHADIVYRGIYIVYICIYKQEARKKKHIKTEKKGIER